MESLPRCLGHFSPSNFFLLTSTQENVPVLALALFPFLTEAYSLPLRHPTSPASRQQNPPPPPPFCPGSLLPTGDSPPPCTTHPCSQSPWLAASSPAAQCPQACGESIVADTAASGLLETHGPYSEGGVSDSVCTWVTSSHPAQRGSLLCRFS